MVLKQNDGLSAISAKALNRVFALVNEPLGGPADSTAGNLPYTKAIAKNTNAWTVQPGSPIELTAFTADYTPGGSRVPGYWDAGRAAKPCLAKKRIAIALELGPPGELFSVALDGIVRANFDDTDFPFASLITDASGTDYQTKITSSPAMGFAMILRKLDATNAILRLGNVAAHRLGVTIAALVPSAEADVTANISGGATETVKAYTTVSTIPSATPILLLPVDGTFYAVKVC